MFSLSAEFLGAGEGDAGHNLARPSLLLNMFL